MIEKTYHLYDVLRTGSHASLSYRELLATDKPPHRGGRRGQWTAVEYSPEGWFWEWQDWGSSK